MPGIAWKEIETHKIETDCWIVLHGNVYNVTEFLENHPGGKAIILEDAGRDATEVFEEAAHSTEARDMLPALLVGHLDGYHDTVQSFDSIVGSNAKDEGAKNRWVETISLMMVSVATLTVWAYARGRSPNIGFPSLLSIVKAEPTLMSGIVILLVVVVGAFCTFTSHVIYVDFGRLDKYPSRIRLA